MSWWQWISVAASALMFVAGAAILLVHRRRSRRATTLALAALVGLAGDWLFGIVLWQARHLWEGAVPRSDLPDILTVIGLARRAWSVGCILLLVWAVVADRRDKPSARPEADYADTPDSRRL